MKKMKRIISLIVAILFFVNNVSYALGPAVTSGNIADETRPGTKDAIYAAAQREFLKKEPGAGSSIDSDIPPGDFTELKKKISEKVDARINRYGTKFIKADYENPPVDWKRNNPILQETNLIAALKMFGARSKILSDKLEIKEGWFPREKDGEVLIARIEPKGNGKYVLIVHTEFVQMWDHIRKNDVWFESDLESGERRTVSVAWGIFYRLAKHEMAELSKRDGTFKSLGHFAYDLDVPHADEDLANAIGGNYAMLNDAMWMWFLGSYAFRNTTRYDNNVFLERINGFFKEKWARERGLNREFPNLKDAFRRLPATAFACAINRNFFGRPGVEVPEAYELKAEFINYHKRDLAREIAGITEKPIYATGTGRAGEASEEAGRRLIKTVDELARFIEADETFNYKTEDKVSGARHVHSVKVYTGRDRRSHPELNGESKELAIRVVNGDSGTEKENILTHKTEIFVSEGLNDVEGMLDILIQKGFHRQLMARLLYNIRIDKAQAAAGDTAKTAPTPTAVDKDTKIQRNRETGIQVTGRAAAASRKSRGVDTGDRDTEAQVTGRAKAAASRTRAGKSPDDLLKLIAYTNSEGEVLSAPVLLKLYKENYEAKPLRFEKPAEKRNSALRTIERDLYVLENSLLRRDLIQPQLENDEQKRGEDNEYLFELTEKGREEVTKLRAQGVAAPSQAIDGEAMEEAGKPVFYSEDEAKRWVDENLLSQMSEELKVDYSDVVEKIIKKLSIDIIQRIPGEIDIFWAFPEFTRFGSSYVIEINDRDKHGKERWIESGKVWDGRSARATIEVFGKIVRQSLHHTENEMTKELRGAIDAGALEDFWLTEFYPQIKSKIFKALPPEKQALIRKYFSGPDGVPEPAEPAESEDMTSLLDPTQAVAVALSEIVALIPEAQREKISAVSIFPYSFYGKDSQQKTGIGLFGLELKDETIESYTEYVLKHAEINERRYGYSSNFIDHGYMGLGRVGNFYAESRLDEIYAFRDIEKVQKALKDINEFFRASGKIDGLILRIEPSGEPLSKDEISALIADKINSAAARRIGLSREEKDLLKLIGHKNAEKETLSVHKLLGWYDENYEQLGLEEPGISNDYMIVKIRGALYGLLELELVEPLIGLDNEPCDADPKAHWKKDRHGEYLFKLTEKGREEVTKLRAKAQSSKPVKFWEMEKEELIRIVDRAEKIFRVELSSATGERYFALMAIDDTLVRMKVAVTAKGPSKDVVGEESMFKWVFSFVEDTVQNVGPVVKSDYAKIIYSYLEKAQSEGLTSPASVTGNVEIEIQPSAAGDISESTQPTGQLISLNAQDMAAGVIKTEKPIFIRANIDVVKKAKVKDAAKLEDIYNFLKESLKNYSLVLHGFTGRPWDKDFDEEAVALSGDYRYVHSLSLLPVVKWYAEKLAQERESDLEGVLDASVSAHFKIKGSQSAEEDLHVILLKAEATPQQTLDNNNIIASFAGKAGYLVFRENRRFDRREQDKDSSVRSKVAQELIYGKDGDLLYDIGIGVDTASAHRKEATNVEVAQFLPILASEHVERFSGATADIRSKLAGKKLTAIIAGAKRDKLDLATKSIGEMVFKGSEIIIEGPIVAAFLKLEGKSIGAMEVTEKDLESARKFMEKSDKEGVGYFIPHNLVIIPKKEIKDAVAGDILEVTDGNVSEGYIIVDTGADDLKAITGKLSASEAVFQSGMISPQDLNPIFNGNEILVKAMAEEAGKGKVVVNVGADTYKGNEIAGVKGVKEEFIQKKEGGAFLSQVISREPLPGIKAIKDSQEKFSAEIRRLLGFVPEIENAMSILERITPETANDEGKSVKIIDDLKKVDVTILKKILNRFASSRRAIKEGRLSLDPTRSAIFTARFNMLLNVVYKKPPVSILKIEALDRSIEELKVQRARQLARETGGMAKPGEKTSAALLEEITSLLSVKKSLVSGVKPAPTPVASEENETYKRLLEMSQNYKDIFDSIENVDEAKLYSFEDRLFDGTLKAISDIVEEVKNAVHNPLFAGFIDKLVGILEGLVNLPERIEKPTLGFDHHSYGYDIPMTASFDTKTVRDKARAALAEVQAIRVKVKYEELKKNSGLPLSLLPRQLPAIGSNNRLWAEALRALHFEAPVYRRVEGEGEAGERFTGITAFENASADKSIKELKTYDVSKKELYSIRKGEDVRGFILKPEAEIPPEAYFMHRGIFGSREDIQKAFYDNKIRFDITVIPPALWGVDLAKTVGHYHDPAEKPEIYQVVSGEVLWLMQKIDKEGNVVDFITVRAKAGDIAIMLPGYGHVSVNFSQTEPLVMANWLTWHQSSYYGSFKEKKGAAYYVVSQEDGASALIPNPQYQKTQRPLPEPRQMTVKDEILNFGLKRGEPIYNLVRLKDADFAGKVRFLNYPGEFDELLTPENTLNDAMPQGKIAILDTLSKAMPTPVAVEKSPILSAISEYVIDIGLNKGPGSVVEPTVKEIAAFYPIYEILSHQTVEIYLPQAAKGSLTAAVKQEVANLNKRIRERTGRKDDAISFRAYDSNNIEKLLENRSEGARRIFVNDNTMTDVFKGLLSQSKAAVLKGSRLITTSIPQIQDKKELSVYQAWLIKVALLSAMVEEGNMLTVGEALREELKDRLGKETDSTHFISNLIGTESEGINEVAKRINYFLGSIVQVSQFIGEQIRILKAFWTAA